MRSISGRTEAAGGDSGRADAHARGDERTFRVVRDGILVGSDVHLVQTALQLLAGHAGLSQVDEHQVVVRAAADQIKALLLECVREHAGVGDDALLVRLELRLECLTEADRLCGDDMLERPPCVPGKMALLNFFASSSSFVRITPPRGPRSVLCVVVVTTSA